MNCYIPYEYNLQSHNEAFDYLSITIENTSVIEVISTCGYICVLYVEGYGRIFEQLNLDS
jgi:hypothetical protein